MSKPIFINVCISIFLSFIIFLGFKMVINEDYKLLEFNSIRNTQNLFYYLWIVLFFPIIDIVLFSVPLYFSLKIKNKLAMIISLLCIFIIEYFIYVYFTSQKTFDEDGLHKVIISILIFTFFFYKTIWKKS